MSDKFDNEAFGLALSRAEAADKAGRLEEARSYYLEAQEIAAREGAPLSAQWLLLITAAGAKAFPPEAKIIIRRRLLEPDLAHCFLEQESVRVIAATLALDLAAKGETIEALSLADKALAEAEADSTASRAELRLQHENARIVRETKCLSPLWS